MDSPTKTITIISKIFIKITVKRVEHHKLVNTHEIWIRQVEVGSVLEWVMDSLQPRKLIVMIILNIDNYQNSMNKM